VETGRPENNSNVVEVVLEEGGLDSGHGERDWLNVVGRQSVAPGKFNIPNIECILVLDKGKALAGAGAFVRRQKEHVGTVLSNLKPIDSGLPLAR